MTAASGTAERWAAVVLLVGAPALMAVLVALNGLQVIEDRPVADQKRSQLMQFETRMKAPASDGKPFDTSPIYLQGGSHALASANLQQQLVSAVASTSGKLIETASLDAEVAAAPGDSPDDTVRLKASLDIDNNGMLQLLYVLESGLPLITVDSISIGRASAQAADANDNPLLRLDLVVSGHWKQAAS